MHAGFGLDVDAGFAKVPVRSPYPTGARVQMHGYPGYPAGLRRTGFRGFVLGWFGGTVLRGLTDDGQEWAEPWGALMVDGKSNNSAARCCCCPPSRSGVVR